MRRLFISFFTALVSFTALAQENYGVADFDKVAGDPAEYLKIAMKFAKGEERLTVRECVIAYYGYAYQSYYTGDLVAGEKEMQESVLAGDLELVYTFGKRVLERYPFNLTALYWTLAAAVETKKPWEERNSLRTRYNNVTLAIAGSGDGLTDETAFKIVNTGDMYTYCMVELEVEVNDRYLWDNRYDMLEVTPSEKFAQDTVWFDSYLPLNLANVLPKHK